MKQLRLAFIALFALAIIGNANAQDEEKPWSIGLDFNAIDFHMGDNIIDDYLGAGDWNISEFLSRLTVGKYLDYGFSVQASVTLNRITTINTENDSDAQFFAFDVNGIYDLNELFGDTGWFDPYSTLGFGYTHLDGGVDIDTGEVVFNVGAGFTAWLNDSIGIKVESLYKTSFGDQINDHFQRSVGVVLKFGKSDDSQ